jgi:hypothetical protein
MHHDSLHVLQADLFLVNFILDFLQLFLILFKPFLVGILVSFDIFDFILMFLDRDSFELFQTISLAFAQFSAKFGELSQHERILRMLDYLDEFFDDFRRLQFFDLSCDDFFFLFKLGKFFLSCVVHI